MCRGEEKKAGVRGRVSQEVRKRTRTRKPHQTVEDPEDFAKKLKKSAM